MLGRCIPRQRFSCQRLSHLFGLLCVSLSLMILLPVCAQETPHIARIEISHGKPFVMITLNGRGPFRFVIDTGTSAQAFISPALASQLDLAQIGQIHISDPSGRGKRTTPLVLIPSIEVAGVQFTGVHAALHDFDDSDGTCQGLLGFALFRSLLLTLDYPHRQLQLTSGSVTPDGERSVLPFRAPNGIPLIAIHIDNTSSTQTSIDALLDSGGAGLSLPESIAARMAFSTDPVHFSDSFSVATRFQVKAGRLSGAIRLGAYTFPQPFIEINSAFPFANFGSVPMQNFAVTFDQHNALVRFDSTHQTLHLSATPTPMHPDNSPPVHPPVQALIPVG